VGLDLRAVFADGVLFEPEELELDIEEYEADVRAAASAAWNLSVNAEYPTAQNASVLLQQASGDAKALAINAAVEGPGRHAGPGHQGRRAGSRHRLADR